MSETRFIIRTSSGDKGPFSSQQIKAFIEAGKLPARAKIFDQLHQQPILADEAAGLVPVEVVAYQRAETDLAPGGAEAQPTAASAPARRGSTSRIQRGTGRTQRGSSSASLKRGTGRTARRGKPGLPLPAIIGIAAGALALIVLLVVLLRPADIASRLPGTWAVDEVEFKATIEQMIKDGKVTPEQQMGLQMVQAFAAMITLEIKADGLILIKGLPAPKPIEANWKAITQEGSRLQVQLEMTTPDGQRKNERFWVSLRGDRLHLEPGKAGEPPLVLKRK